MRRPGSLVGALIDVYAVTIILWQVLRLIFGDRWWWLAVTNVLSLYLFLPLVILIPLALLSRRRKALVATAIPLVIFFVLFGELFVPRFSQVNADDAQTVRVMTLNVLYLNDDGKAIERLAEDAQPDIICLQELTPRIAADLQVRLNDDYPYHFLLPKEGTVGVGVFSRYPLYDKGMLPDPAEEIGWWRNGAQRVTVDFAGQPILVLNIHALPPYSGMSDPHWPQLFEMGVQLREQELERWMEWVEQQTDPVIVAGDFNLTDQNAGYGLVAEQLNDTHRQAGWGWGHTWQAPRTEYAGLPLPSRLLRLDYVWCSDHWRVIESHVSSWDGQSDHLPVVATLALSDGN